VRSSAQCEGAKATEFIHANFPFFIVTTVNTLYIHDKRIVYTLYIHRCINFLIFNRNVYTLYIYVHTCYHLVDASRLQNIYTIYMCTYKCTLKIHYRYEKMYIDACSVTFRFFLLLCSLIGENNPKASMKENPCSIYANITLHFTTCWFSCQYNTCSKYERESFL
jgi:hypothetical protein